MNLDARLPSRLRSRGQTRASFGEARRSAFGAKAARSPVSEKPPGPPQDDDKPKAPETPPDEPRPQPVQDPPDEVPEKGPYTVH
jgi:hypothetical protein